MLENVVTILTTVVGLITVVWQFFQSEQGRALITIWQNHGVMGARAFLEQQALCIVTKYKQQLVDGLREDAADGIITKEELAARLKTVKDQALADFKASAVGGATQRALQILGVQDVDKQLDQLLEGAVFKLKQMTPPPTTTRTAAIQQTTPSGTETVTVTETKEVKEVK